MHELVAQVLEKFAGARVIDEPPLMCDDCGRTDQLVYLTSDSGETYCGKCARRSAPPMPAKRNGRSQELRPVVRNTKPAEKYKRPLYRMHDSENAGCHLIGPNESPEQWQADGHGIFWAVNKFHGGVRQVKQLDQILSWAIDIDHGTKEAQRARLLAAPLIPSMIVETKRGYQAYWNAKKAEADHWNAIVLDRLVPYFGADPNARDIARILRAPGYLHQKDPKDPFMVRVVHQTDVAYTEAQMVEKFPDLNKTANETAERLKIKGEVKFEGSDAFWDRVYNLDCEDGLRRLSGHACVGGEVFTFKQVATGNKNIRVNGKGTSCWIDRNKRIGSMSGGGPTLAQWIKWYGHSYGEAAKVIKQLYPEIVK